MTYSAMAADVLHFCQSHDLKKISLLGHSMGGKVAMSFALSPHLPPDVLQNLVVVDIAPGSGKMSQEFITYVETMQRIEEMGVHTRKEAESVLEEVEPDKHVRAFLLTNFEQSEPRRAHASHRHTHHKGHSPSSSSSTASSSADSQDDHKPGHFRVPLQLLADSIHEIGAFPYESGERTWDGRTLFVKGERSRYINKHNIPLAKEFFPNMELKTLDTDHWVHAERPREFKALVEAFVRGEELPE
ncbi:hypothetical protein HGRIS_011064 [Hohenbuehelia grisea]